MKVSGRRHFHGKMSPAGDLSGERFYRTVSEILKIFVLHSPIPPQLWGCFRCTRSPMLGSLWAGALSYSAVKLCSKHSNLCENHTSTSQTDGRTDDCGTALCVASRGKNCTRQTFWSTFLGTSVAEHYIRVIMTVCSAETMPPTLIVQLWTDDDLLQWLVGSAEGKRRAMRCRHWIDVTSDRPSRAARVSFVLLVISTADRRTT